MQARGPRMIGAIDGEVTGQHLDPVSQQLQRDCAREEERVLEHAFTERHLERNRASGPELNRCIGSVRRNAGFEGHGDVLDVQGGLLDLEGGVAAGLRDEGDPPGAAPAAQVFHAVKARHIQQQAQREAEKNLNGK